MLRSRDMLDVAAIAVFLVFLALCGALVYFFGDLTRIEKFRFFDLAVLSLAAFRVLHLITYDKIFSFVRHFFDRRGKRETEGGVHKYIDSFLECLWCTGMWSGVIVLTTYLLGPWGRLVVYAFAVAGMASLVQVISIAIYRLSEKARRD